MKLASELPARFNGAADGDRRRVASGDAEAAMSILASTEPPTVIGGEVDFCASGNRLRLLGLQRSRRR